MTTKQSWLRHVNVEYQIEHNWTTSRCFRIFLFVLLIQKQSTQAQNTTITDSTHLIRTRSFPNLTLSSMSSTFPVPTFTATESQLFSRTSSVSHDITNHMFITPSGRIVSSININEIHTPKSTHFRDILTTSSIKLQSSPTFSQISNMDKLLNTTAQEYVSNKTKYKSSETTRNIPSNSMRITFTNSVHLNTGSSTGQVLPPTHAAVESSRMSSYGGERSRMTSVLSDVHESILEEKVISSSVISSKLILESAYTQLISPSSSTVVLYTHTKGDGSAFVHTSAWITDYVNDYSLVSSMHTSWDVTDTNGGLDVKETSQILTSEMDIHETVSSVGDGSFIVTQSSFSKEYMAGYITTKLLPESSDFFTIIVASPILNTYGINTISKTHSMHTKNIVSEPNVYISQLKIKSESVNNLETTTEKDLYIPSKIIKPDKTKLKDASNVMISEFDYSKLYSSRDFEYTSYNLYVSTYIYSPAKPSDSDTIKSRTVSPISYIYPGHFSKNGRTSSFLLKISQAPMYSSTSHTPSLTPSPTYTHVPKYSSLSNNVHASTIYDKSTFQSYRNKDSTQFDTYYTVNNKQSYSPFKFSTSGDIFTKYKPRSTPTTFSTQSEQPTTYYDTFTTRVKLIPNETVISTSSNAIYIKPSIITISKTKDMPTHLTDKTVKSNTHHISYNRSNTVGTSLTNKIDPFPTMSYDASSSAYYITTHSSEFTQIVTDEIPTTSIPITIVINTPMFTKISTTLMNSSENYINYSMSNTLKTQSINSDQTTTPVNTFPTGTITASRTVASIENKLNRSSLTVRPSDMSKTTTTRTGDIYTTSHTFTDVTNITSIPITTETHGQSNSITTESDIIKITSSTVTRETSPTLNLTFTNESTSQSMANTTTDNIIYMSSARNVFSIFTSNSSMKQTKNTDSTIHTTFSNANYTSTDNVDQKTLYNNKTSSIFTTKEKATTGMSMPTTMIHNTVTYNPTTSQTTTGNFRSNETASTVTVEKTTGTSYVDTSNVTDLPTFNSSTDTSLHTIYTPTPIPSTNDNLTMNNTTTIDITTTDNIETTDKYVTSTTIQTTIATKINITNTEEKSETPVTKLTTDIDLTSYTVSVETSNAPTTEQTTTIEMLTTGSQSSRTSYTSTDLLTTQTTTMEEMKDTAATMDTLTLSKKKEQTTMIDLITTTDDLNVSLPQHLSTEMRAKPTMPKVTTLIPLPSTTEDYLSKVDAQYQCKIIILVTSNTTITSPAFKKKIKNNLLRVYQFAYSQQHSKTRKKKAVHDIRVQVLSIVREGTTERVNVKYAVEKDGTVVDSDTSATLLESISLAEMVDLIGYFVSPALQASTIPVPTTSAPITDNQYWIIGVVLGSIAAVVAIVILIIIIYLKFCILPLKFSHAAEDPAIHGEKPIDLPFHVECSQINELTQKNCVGTPVFRSPSIQRTYSSEREDHEINPEVTHTVFNDNENYNETERPSNGIYENLRDPMTSDTLPQSTEAMPAYMTDERVSSLIRHSSSVASSEQPAIINQHNLSHLIPSLQRGLYGAELITRAAVERQRNKQRLRERRKAEKKDTRHRTEKSWRYMPRDIIRTPYCGTESFSDEPIERGISNDGFSETDAYPESGEEVEYKHPQEFCQVPSMNQDNTRGDNRVYPSIHMQSYDCHSRATSDDRTYVHHIHAKDFVSDTADSDSVRSFTCHINAKQANDSLHLPISKVYHSVSGRRRSVGTIGDKSRRTKVRPLSSGGATGYMLSGDSQHDSPMDLFTTSSQHNPHPPSPSSGPESCVSRMMSVNSQPGSPVHAVGVSEWKLNVSDLQTTQSAWSTGKLVHQRNEDPSASTTPSIDNRTKAHLLCAELRDQYTASVEGRPSSSNIEMQDITSSVTTYHAVLGKTAGFCDEYEVIQSLKPGMSPAPLIQSVREELQRLSQQENGASSC